MYKFIAGQKYWMPVNDLIKKSPKKYLLVLIIYKNFYACVEQKIY